MKEQITLQEWLDALRSGKFAQGKHRLKKGSEYCCLGVGVELTCGFLKKGCHEVCRISEDASLPHKFISDLPVGMRGGGVPFSIITDEGEVTTLNDNKGKTFSEIADIVERDAKSLGWGS